MSKVIQISEHQKRIAPSGERALYLRIGRNDHPAIPELITRGERRFFDVVIDAQATQRYSELVAETARPNAEAILDIKTQPLSRLRHTLGKRVKADEYGAIAPEPARLDARKHSK